jgi:hypothetical protein
MRQSNTIANVEKPTNPERTMDTHNLIDRRAGDSRRGMLVRGWDAGIIAVSVINPTDPRRIATLWQLAFNENQLSCAVYRQDQRFQLRVESPTAVIVSEAFDLQPRALARARALSEALKRRGWIELVAQPPPADSDA